MKKTKCDFKIVDDKFQMPIYSEMFCCNCVNEDKCTAFHYDEDDNRVEPCTTYQDFVASH